MGLQVQSRIRVAAWCAAVALLGLLATSGSAAAAPKRISGKLSEPGYTVIALAANGKAKSVRVRRGRFLLRPSATRVTLHLRAPNGTYAGPIVVGRRKRGRLSILGVRAGARLGKVRVRRGHAKVSKRLRRQWVDASRRARARNGVPIGAGVFGRVRSRHVRASAPGDRDLDGIPDVLDIDDDGDRILDSFDRSRAARAAQGDEPGFQLQTSLGVGLQDSANANAPGLTPAQIEAALPAWGRVDIQVLPGGELDCGRPQKRTDPTVGGRIYCSRGGTGTLGRYEEPPYPEFPECCDSDGDGFGRLLNTGDSPEGTPFMFLFPGATSAQIGTGDLLIQRITEGGVERERAALLGYMFATVPALKSYDDGAGNSMTVSYPVAGHQPGPPGPGVQGNPFPVEARPNGNVILTLTFWRPQRRPIPGEAGYSDPPTSWTDIGRLNYTAGINSTPLGCPQGSFSENDPNLAQVSYTGGSNYDGLADLVADRPADPANTFTYTLNLTECLSSHGRSFNRGQERGFDFSGIAPASGDDTTQAVHFKRQ
ncbi:MAG: hypothetical protein ACRDQ2_07350 [Gaiellales bacterium]